MAAGDAVGSWKEVLVLVFNRHQILVHLEE